MRVDRRAGVVRDAAAHEPEVRECLVGGGGGAGDPRGVEHPHPHVAGPQRCGLARRARRWCGGAGGGRLAPQLREHRVGLGLLGEHDRLPTDRLPGVVPRQRLELQACAVVRRRPMNARTSSLSAPRSKPVSALRFGISASTMSGAMIGSSSVALDRDAPELLDEVLLALDAVDVGVASSWRPPLAGLRSYLPLGRGSRGSGPGRSSAPAIRRVVAARDRGRLRAPVSLSRVTGREVDGHAADRVHDVLEGLEVHLEVVLDRRRRSSPAACR